MKKATESVALEDSTQITPGSRSKECILLARRSFEASDRTTVGHLGKGIDIVVRAARMTLSGELDGAIAEQDVLPAPVMIPAVRAEQRITQPQIEVGRVIGGKLFRDRIQVSHEHFAPGQIISLRLRTSNPNTEADESAVGKITVVLDPESIK